MLPSRSLSRHYNNTHAFDFGTFEILVDLSYHRGIPEISFSFIDGEGTSKVNLFISNKRFSEGFTVSLLEKLIYRNGRGIIENIFIRSEEGRIWNLIKL